MLERTWDALRPFLTFLLLVRGRSDSSSASSSSALHTTSYQQQRQEEEGLGYSATAAGGGGVGGAAGLAAAEALMEELTRLGCVADEELVSLLIPFLARHLVVSPVVTEADG